MKTINLGDQASHDCGNVPLKRYADYAGSASFIKSPKIMFVLPHYAKAQSIIGPIGDPLKF